MLFVEEDIQDELPRQRGTKNTGEQREDIGPMERLGECQTEMVLWLNKCLGRSCTGSNSVVQNTSNF